MICFGSLANCRMPENKNWKPCRDDAFIIPVLFCATYFDFVPKRAQMSHCGHCDRNNKLAK